MEVTHVMPVWQAVFTGLIGLLYVGAGYRTMRVTARITSALLLMTIGALVATRVEHPAATVAIIAGAGILGYLAGNAFYFVSVALYGAVAGVLGAFLIAFLLGGPLGWMGGIAGALAGGTLALLFERPLGILCTSLIGGTLTALSTQAIVTGGAGHEPVRFGWAYAALLGGLALVGCVIQARTTKNLPAQGSPGPSPASSPK